MDDDRQTRILEGALSVFLRYGYRRTSMEDIARAVGISRPALYLQFPNKEAIFRHAIEASLRHTLDEIEAGVATHHGLASQLEHVFEVWSVRALETVLRSPNAEELLTTSYDFVNDVFERAGARLTEIIAEVIRVAVADPKALHPSAKARARTMIAAAHGFKTMTRDPGEMRALLRDLVRIVVASLPTTSALPKRPMRSR